jgi:hypothetical protein
MSFLHISTQFESLISEKIIGKEKSKKGKPWNSTRLLSAQGLSLCGLAARGKLQT